MSIEKHEGQHSTEINRVICRRVCYTYITASHISGRIVDRRDGKYFLSPGAQSASILGGDKGPTAGNPVDCTEAALREELASPRAAGKTSTKHHCWRGELKISR